MTGGDEDLLELLFDLLVFAGDDDDFQRRFDGENGLEEAFDGTDAETAGELEEDGAVADEALAAEAFAAVFRLAENGMDRDAGDGNVRGGNAPVSEIAAPSSVAVVYRSHGWLTQRRWVSKSVVTVICGTDSFFSLCRLAMISAGKK